ncbi:MAG: cation transporter [Rhizobiaceae bacterium]|nr:MAG: cation transporter [Rhizobiaceae bacterium]CAG0953931.1 Cadmium, cobalt and zinc/H(+)-K(+) antiporter [Rhizobiaceae bacterium]
MAAHRHHHHHVDPGAGDRRVALAIAVNLGLTLAQIAGGIVSGSLALIADAVHNFSDAVSLIIAFAARRIARRPTDASMSFGYGRIEVVAALVNYTSLIIIGFYLVFEAIARFLDPQGVDGWIVVVIAAIALLVDVITALLTWSLSRESVNIRAAFLHNVADALGSVAVIVAGTLILLYDWHLVDPLVTLMIAAYILWQSFAEIGPVIRILMNGSPADVAAADVVARIRTVDGVRDVHHAHLWQMQEHASALDAHVVIEEGAWSRADAVKASVKALLAEEFGIAHSMIELECSRHACRDAPTFGHPQVPAEHRH